MTKEEKQIYYLKHSFDLFETKCSGGAWYIPTIDIANVYHAQVLSPEFYALKELHMGVDPRNVGEYFADTAYIEKDSKVINIKMKFYIFKN